MRRAVLPLLAAALALGGCSFTDCSFETARTETVGGLLLANGTGVGDTLTVAFVVDAGPFLNVTVADGVGGSPGITPDGAVEVLYDAVARSVSGDLVARPLVAAPRGDTVFVYVEGSLDPSFFALACSAPESVVDVEVRAVLVPEGVVAARVATVSLSDLHRATATALRQSDAAQRVGHMIST